MTFEINSLPFVHTDHLRQSSIVFETFEHVDDPLTPHALVGFEYPLFGMTVSGSAT